MKIQRVLFQVILVLVAAVVLVMAWKVPGFADGYVKYAFPVWVETYGRLTGLAPVSVGEIMIVVALCYVALTIVMLIVRFVLAVNGHELFKKFTKFNMKLFAHIVVFVVFVQVMNCFALYKVTPLYVGTEYADRAYSYAELFELRDKLVTKANIIAENLERDEKGYIVCNMTADEMEEKAVVAMKKVGMAADGRLSLDEGTASDGSWSATAGGSVSRGSVIDGSLARLKGYYSSPKALYFSEFMSQQYMAGWYFPFSLEANYNKLMYVSEIPETLCHELAHLKGFILEDEANFISYLACESSGNQLFEYSGLLMAIGYVNEQCSLAIKEVPERAEMVKVQRSDLVKFDAMFLTPEAWAEVEKKAVLKTEDVQEVTDKFVNANLELNGVADGKESYGRVVDLILRYESEME